MIDTICAFLTNQKIIMTIVEQGLASRLLKAVRNAGSDGGTVMPGVGTAPPEKWDFFGICRNPHKEVLLTVIDSEKVDSILHAIDEELNLSRSTAGISFVLHLQQVRGAVHRLEQIQEGENMSQGNRSGYELIVSIVEKGYADVVIDAAREKGATGGTILGGRGVGIHEKSVLFGRPIEPEKEIVLTLVTAEQMNDTLDSIMEKADICKPGRGIVFVLDVERAVGLPEAP